MISKLFEKGFTLIKFLIFILLIIILFFLFFRLPEELQDKSLVHDNQAILDDVNYLLEIKEKIHPDMPYYFFRVYGNEMDNVYSVDRIVVLNQDKEIIQEISFDSTKNLNSRNLGIVIEDINFDDYKDIRIESQISPGTNIPYYYWIWDKEKTKFIRDIKLEEIISPEFNYQDKTINSSIRISADKYQDYIYKYINNEITLFRIITREINFNDNVFNVIIEEIKGDDKQIIDQYQEPIN